jgi:serine protease AprX
MNLRVTARPLVGAVLLAAMFAATPAQATILDPSTPALQPMLLEHLADVTGGTPVRVMVQAGGDLAAAKSAIRKAGLVPEVTLDRVGIAVAAGTPAQVRALESIAAVTRVDWADEPLALASNTSHQATRATAVHNGAVDVDADGTPDKFTGKGFSVAIVDSGIDGTHPMFAGADGTSRVKKNVKIACSDAVPVLTGIFLDDSYQTADSCAVDATAVNDTDSPSLGGHGTHVTGIAAGGIVTDASGRKLRGAAPDAEIVGVSGGVSLSVYGGALGLYWVLTHHADPCGDGSCAPVIAVNNSWGPVGGGTFDATSPHALVQRALVSEGVSVVWAAGNDGGDGTSNVTNPYGADPTPGILSVANYDDGGEGRRDNALDSSSSRGLNGSPFTYPDLSAPGAMITSACRPYLSVCATGLDLGDPNYNTISGTSMAAPHVAGYIAVLQQAALKKLGHLLSPGEIEDLLVNTAHPFGSRVYESDPRNPDSETKTSFDAGHGLVDVLAAIERLTGQTSNVVEAGCPIDGRFTDPAGDATGAMGTGTPGPNSDGLDVVEAWLDAAPGTSDLTFTWKVTDLAESPGGLEGTGEYFDFNFLLGEAEYYVTASRTVDTGESYDLGHFDTTGRATIAPVSGSFDPATDTITVTLPAQTWATAGLPGAIAPGTTVGKLSIVGRRSLVAVVPDADTAASTCAYVVGAEDIAHAAPVAHATATPATVPVGTVVTLDGTTSTDADSSTDALTFAWDFGDGGTTTDSTSPQATVAYAAAGTKGVTLTVTDEGGRSDTDVVSVVVSSSSGTNTPPTAKVNSDRTNADVGVAFGFTSAGSSDIESGGALGYDWDFGDGTSHAAGPTASHAYAQKGAYTVTLTATDSEGASDTDTLLVTVTKPNHAPIASAFASPSTVAVESSVTLDARGSTDQDTGDTLSFAWDFGDGGWTTDAKGAVVTTSFDEVGEYVATATVTDSAGATSTAKVTVHVVEATVNEAPAAFAVASPGWVLVGDFVSLRGGGSGDAETAVNDLTYSWDFDNGGTVVDATTKRAKVAYADPGIKVVTLTVTDEAGQVDEMAIRVVVAARHNCEAAAVDRDAWRIARSDRANGGRYCDTLVQDPGLSKLSFTSNGDVLRIAYGKSQRGGVANVIVDGETVTQIDFRGDTRWVTMRTSHTIQGLGAGEHRVVVKMVRGEGFLDYFAF